MSKPSSAEIAAALVAIRASDPNADVLRLGVHVASAVDEPGQRLIYLDAEHRDTMEAGHPYTTWVVTFVGGSAVNADFFCSRACASPGS